MISAPVRSIIPSLKLGDYLSVQTHKPCSISNTSSIKIIFSLSLLVIFSWLSVFSGYNDGC